MMNLKSCNIKCREYASKAKDVEEKVNERVAKRRKVEEEGIDKIIKAVDSIDEVKKEKKVSEALDKAEEAQAKLRQRKINRFIV